MSQPSMFRQEALEFWSRGQGTSGGVLRLTPGWTRWSYWVVLALLTAGLVFSIVLHTDESASGPALVNLQQWSFVALLPPRSEVNPGQKLNLELLTRSGRLSAHVSSIQLADEVSARQAGLRSVRFPAALVSGVVDPKASEAMSRSASPRLDARATVVVGQERVLVVFARGLKQMLGKGGQLR